MINAQILQGQWNEIKGILKQHWGDLSNDDLKRFNGDVDQLVGIIQRKTGETRQAVQDYLEEITADTSSTVADLMENGRQYVSRAAATVDDAMGNVAGQLRDRYGDAEEMVRVRPAESVAVAFGIGMLAGLVLALFVRDR